jgi:DinB superfamily
VALDRDTVLGRCDALRAGALLDHASPAGVFSVVPARQRRARVARRRVATRMVRRMDRCDDCGFEYQLQAAPAASRAIVQGTGELAALVSAAPEVERRRDPEVWSPLEYGCHLRDVLLVQRERVLAARRMDCPSFDPMGREERAEHDGYAQQDPERVARELSDAAFMFANVLDRLDKADWERTVMYNYPAVSERSLRWMAVHTEHEVKHHLLDVRRQL